MAFNKNQVSDLQLFTPIPELHSWTKTLTITPFLLVELFFFLGKNPVFLAELFRFAAKFFPVLWFIKVKISVWKVYYSDFTFVLAQ